MLKNTFFVFSILLVCIFTSTTNSQTIATGTYFHAVVLNSSGSIYTWGRNFHGQLGNNSNINSSAPVSVFAGGVLSGKTITAVSGGNEFSFALASDGKVYGWGFNAGNLGIGSSGAQIVPVAVDMSGALSGKTITKIAGGYRHTIALASDGTVYGWGYNNSGQLGTGNFTFSNVPVAVDMAGVLSGKTIIAIAAGYDHSVALASDGTVFTWGHNGFGQLGNGLNSNSNSPVAVNTSGVLDGVTIASIAAGGYHTILLADDGTVYSVGYNNRGQLGDASEDNRNTPVEVDISGVLSGKTITKIAGSFVNTFAIDSDGKAYSWGYNAFGQLGNGTGVDSDVPVEVDMTGVLAGKVITEIAGGGEHAIALTSEGLVYGWGYNNQGQLGDGSTDTRTTPVQATIAALPVELTSFTANITDGKVKLNWETATEVNNYGFEVEKQNSEAGSQESEWQRIGFVQGNGNLNSPVSYSFVDDQLAGEKAMYRLKQIDIDGSYEYSDVVEINVGLPVEFSLEQNYPNPFNPSTKIGYSIPIGRTNGNSSVRLAVYDALGNLVVELVNEDQSAGNYEVEFNASGLSSGLYFYRLTTNEFSSTKKMLLLK